MFSPSYFRARRRELFPDPQAHCGLNVALYGGVSRWAFTEPGPIHTARRPTRLTIGGSALAWEGDVLVVRIDERTPGTLRPVRGEVRLYPSAAGGVPIPLDAAGRHQWWCIAPGARVSVDLEQPRQRWTGAAYLDSNFGREPLEQAFAGWSWSRADTERGTTVLYDTRPLGVQRVDERALLFTPDGRIETWAAEVAGDLPATKWRIARSTRSDAADVRVLRTLEDTPFYARSLLTTERFGRPVTVVHEELDLRRFVSPVVQFMLPFRMRGGRRR